MKISQKIHNVSGFGRRIFSQGFDWLLVGLFPPRCLISGEPGTYLAKKYHDFPPPPENEASFHHLDAITAATAYYDPVVQKLVEHFKYKNAKHLREILAKPMKKISAEKFSEFTIVPIPLHWSRRWWRGYNQAMELVKAFQEIDKHISVSQKLKRARRTAQQARLNRSERLENLSNAFVWRGAKIPRKILLVDDVVATGATLDMAAKALKEAGAQRVEALVFARGGQRKKKSETD